MLPDPRRVQKTDDYGLRKRLNSIIRWLQEQTKSLYANIDISTAEGEGIAVSGRFGWRDITGQIRERGVGSTDPSWAVISGSVFSGYQFAINDEVWIEFHIPHDYLPDSNVHFHCHWLSDGTDVSNPVKWEWDFVYADGYGQQSYAFSTPTVVSAQQVSAGQHYHMVTETAEVDGTGIEVDGIVYCRMRRVTNGATDSTDGIFVITTDLHYQSTNLATRNRNPDFYALTGDTLVVLDSGGNQFTVTTVILDADGNEFDIGAGA